jgi:hypothetical protein
VRNAKAVNHAVVRSNEQALKPNCRRYHQMKKFIIASAALISLSLISPASADSTHHHVDGDKCGHCGDSECEDKKNTQWQCTAKDKTYCYWKDYGVCTNNLPKGADRTTDTNKALEEANRNKLKAKNAKTMADEKKNSH